MASEIIDNGPSDIDEAEEWMNNPEYQEFVAQAAKHCRCANSPCHGVLAGGMCDGIDDSEDECERDAYDWWKEDGDDDE